jgi:hypothetical protein
MSRDVSLRNRPDLARIVTDEFPDNPPASAMIDAFLRHRHAYRADFVDDLVSASREASRPWELRRLASLMLQAQLLTLSDWTTDAVFHVLDRLGLFDTSRPCLRLNRSVLKEGYTTTEPSGFLREFRRRLSRLSSIVNPMIGPTVSAYALRNFLAASRQDCHLPVSRYLFTPEEVAGRVRASVRCSSGEPATAKHPFILEEGRRVLAALPDFEASMLRALIEGSATFWVAIGSSSRIHAMVERPIGTVVLTLKPPGSALEFEIKRAGHRAELPLGVVYERAGKTVPPAHRLDGGSTEHMLQWEAGHSARLTRIYRLVHHSAAPVSITVSIVLPNSLPVGDGQDVHLVDYFSDPAVFNDEFPAMRAAMRRVIDAFAAERGSGLEELPGEWGEALRFLQQMTPAQSILVGSSSFRLDLLSRYLSVDGVKHYFADGLKQKPTRADARRFADAVLEEMLGTYRPPRVVYRSHSGYLDAAFSVASNRARADRVHASLVRQLGTFWGTVLAVRGFSVGESFVARNVGIKSVWYRGRWQVRIVFMDHDNLQLPKEGDHGFRPEKAFPGILIDETHITGNPVRGPNLVCAVDHLRSLYRIDAITAQAHLSLLRRSMVHAYRKTQRSLFRRPTLKSLFPDRFVEESLAWDRAVAIYLRNSESADWRVEAEAMLAVEGLPEDVRRRFLKAIDEFSGFLKRFSFLIT